MSVLLKRESFLNFTELVEFQDGSLSFGLMTLPDVSERLEDTFTIVEGGDTLEIFALEYYGSTELWWIIAEANGMLLPEVEMYDGRQLRIPGSSRVDALLSGRR